MADFHASLDQSLVRVFHTPAQSAPEWRTSDKDPRIEVYGREVDGVFRYTHWRFKARPTAAAVQPAARACKNGRCPR